MKKALITGITGQDGSYLAELLLNKGYQVHGIKRRSSLINTTRVDHIFKNENFHLHYGDLADPLNILSIVKKVLPDEIYNLAAMSHVGVSFELPEYTADINGLGALRLLECIRLLGLEKNTKFYQASTSELYGMVQEVPQNEKTPFYPRSPYAISKQFAYWTTVNYREAYGIYACNGILFNHESPVRGETFVTRKITRGIAAYLLGHIDCIYLGNLEAQRDWGHARDYVEGMYLMMQKDIPEDYVLATGKTITIREMVKLAFDIALKPISFFNNGNTPEDEIGYVFNSQTGGETPVVKIDRKYYRPTEVDLLIGDASKAHNKLGWSPKCDLRTMLEEMIYQDISDIRKFGYNG